MPIPKFVFGTMRMNVSQFFMYELGLKKNSQYHPDKKEFKEIQEISNDSMQCCMNNINETDVKKLCGKLEVVSDTLPKHNFIPYPDHNYGQQPPLTPPEETKHQESVKKEEADTKDTPPSDQHLTDNEEEQEGVTRCICGFEHDDGYMICCDNCSSWQHIECMGIKSSKVPEKYSCHKCSPRELDIEGARVIQAKKKENMSEDDDDEDDETCSEDETSSKTMYTAISNTPTRITLLSNTSQQSNQGTLKSKNRRGNKVPKKKLSDQRNTRRKTKKKEKNDLLENDIINGEADLFPDSNTLNDYISAHKLYEEIEENKYDEELKNMHFKLQEAVPPIDFKNIVKCHHVLDVCRNRKGLVASYDIPCGKFILEYKGTLMSRKKFVDSCHPPEFKNICPYVVNYTKIEHMYLVIDARDYGNDARFVRRSCTPNAELQHITSNGAIHIMIISRVDILQDKEITVPFDFKLPVYKGHVECACNFEECVIKKQNKNSESNKLINNTESVITTVPIPPVPNENNTVKTDSQEETQESENELNANGEESKQEKLSREERKLQAYMKQFEKLEKKQDVVKKGKEPKTPIAKVPLDENMTPSTPVIKPAIAKKVTGGKRKISFTGKRRTRQSSCSSEPVSPTEQDPNTCVSTPTTPTVSISNTTHLDASHVLSRRTRKDKEPLTLTLPLQKKQKQDQPILSPTPSINPVVPPLQSPTKVSEPQTSLVLTVDTQLESESLKINNSNCLLQIVPSTEPRTVATCTVGMSTCEEKIGDVTSRLSEPLPPPAPKRVPHVQREGHLQRKYYGSIKKHWLRHYSQNNSRLKGGQPIGSKQICLAALVASLSREHQPLPTTHYPSMKRTNSLPLRKRFLTREANRKVDIPTSSANVYPFCGTMQHIENNLNADSINITGSSAFTCSRLIDSTSSKTNSSYITESALGERIPLPGNVDNACGATTKLTYSLMCPPNARRVDTDILRNELITSVTALQSTFEGNLKTLSDNAYLQVDSYNEVSKELMYSNTNSFPLQDHMSVENTQSCPYEGTSSLHSSIENSNSLHSATETTTTSNPIAVTDTQLFPLVLTDISQNGSHSTISSSVALPKTSCSSQNLPATSRIPQMYSRMETTYSELLSSDKESESITMKENMKVSMGNCIESTGVTLLSGIATTNENDKIDEPSHKKQCMDVTDEGVGLEIDVLEPSDTPERSFNTSETSSSLLVSSQNDFRIQNLSDNSIENDIGDTSTICNNVDGNLDGNLMVAQECGTGGRKKLSFKEYRSRQRSQKVPTSHFSHLTTTSENNAHLPSMPVSPAQKINQAAGLLLTPRTVSLRTLDRAALYTNHLETYMPISSPNYMECKVSNTDTNESDALSGANIPFFSIVTTAESPNVSSIQVNNIKIESGNVQGKSTLVESGSKQSADLDYRNDAPFEPVSPSMEYDSESPAEDAVAYMNTIHTEITKNPFSIHNNITKHPFVKKTDQNLGVDITEIDDDASSTHSNLSSASYGSVSEGAHDRVYPPHHRIFPREHDSRDYPTREPIRESREYFHNGSHTSLGPHQYYQGYNQMISQGPRPGVHRFSGFAPHNNYSLPSNQTPRQRQTQRGYIPF